MSAERVYCAFELAIFDSESVLTVGASWMPEPRKCCECDSEFTPIRDKQIRCVPCQVASDF